MLCQIANHPGLAQHQRQCIHDSALSAAVRAHDRRLLVVLRDRLRRVQAISMQLRAAPYNNAAASRGIAAAWIGIATIPEEWRTKTSISAQRR
jgi:predicted ribonuclease YlaK